MARKQTPGTSRKGAAVVRARGRPAWADDFIAALRSNGGNVTNAAPAAGIAVRTAYDLRYDSPEFEAEWLEAVRIGSKEMLEEMATSAQERATRGWLEPVYFNGKLVGSKRKFDHDLAWKFLRCAFPDKYNVPSNVNVTEGDVAALVEVMALAVATEASPEIAERIFETWERDAFSRLRGAARRELARTVAVDGKDGAGPSLDQ